MTTEPLSAALTREHHEIDTGLAEFTARGDAEALTRVADALRRHIYLEEEFVFPTLRASGLMAPVLVMLREHGQIWRALDAAEGAAAAGAPVRAAVDELTGLLERHNAKEEPILYPRADAVLDASAADAVTDFLASGQTPEGWVCSLAGS